MTTKFILIQPKSKPQLVGFEGRTHVWSASDSAPETPLTETNIAWLFAGWDELKAGRIPEEA